MKHRLSSLSKISQKGSALLRRVAKRSSSNFKFAFLFLGSEQRDALRDIYEYCRVIDDIVDEREDGPEGIKQAELELEKWRDEVARIYASPRSCKTQLGQRLAEAKKSFAFPRSAFEEIINGCAMDLVQSTYPDAESLELYCYRVASCVGLLCMPIFGDFSKEAELAESYAKHLGLALQYTNILRDVAEDAARGRIYLPLDLLEKHGSSHKAIFEMRYDDSFLAVAEEFASRAEREYQAATRLLDQIKNSRPLFSAEIMGQTYHQILCDLRENRFNVFIHRPSLRRRDKIKAALSACRHTTLRLPTLP